jgi:RNA recognition motif-containing protein
MSVNIYVGNLAYNVTETQLEELFGHHGEVTSVKIIKDHFSGKSKGFGFIEMTDKNAAENSIKELDGKSLENRNIRVNLARPRNDRSDDGGRNNRF